ncbi:MAG: M28 family peptidase [Bacteroidetes bacterium]|nr:M28 family peptidase [Bacteroidota bacterium]
MKLLFLSFLLFDFIQTSAQKTDASINLDIVEFINPEKMIEDIRDFASPAFEGREVGTIGNKKATNWISYKFEQIGLYAFPGQSSYEQEFTVHNYITGRNNFISTGDSLLKGKTVSPAIWGRIGKIRGGLVSSLDSSFAGKIVLHKLEAGLNFNAETFNRVYHHSVNLQKLGAIGIIYYWPSDFTDGVNLYRFEEFVEIPLLAQKNIANTAKPFIIENQLPIPIHFTNRSNGEYLNQYVSRTVSLNTDFGVDQEEMVYNEIGYLPGKNERLDRAVVIVADLDQEGSNSVNGTPYLGANNNASGIVSMLEIARVLKSLKKKPDYSIIFIALNGSRRNKSGLLALQRSPILKELKNCSWVEIQSIAYSMNEDDISHARVFVESRNNDFKRLVDLASRRPKIDVSLFSDFVQLDGFYSNYIRITADESPYSNRVVDAQNKLDFVSLYRLTQLSADIIWRIVNDND